MFIFHAIIPPLMLVCLNLNEKQNSNQNGKVVVLVKTFDHFDKFQPFQQSCKIVKEFETEIYIRI